MYETKTFDLTRSYFILSHLEVGSQKRKKQWTIMRLLFAADARATISIESLLKWHQKRCQNA